ncbi:lysocardiolipin acyltransferase 1-like, partial [Heptranchias perlo]|uniref:lysocardiolipin acyltransferase 1-like n=1 Tax=Heptranchias perlo TaxID=212740 RepID=UPI00355A239B
SNLDAIHDITVAYPHNIPQTERDLFTGNFPKEIHFHIHRFSSAHLPTTVDGLQEWCCLRWQDKERLLRNFYQGGRSFRALDQGQGLGQGQGQVQGRVQGQGRVPPCKSRGRVFLIKCFSILYWTGFVGTMFVLIWRYTLARWYFASAVIFFVAQEKIFGGCELMEIAVHNRKPSRRWAKRQ